MVYIFHSVYFRLHTEKNILSTFHNYSKVSNVSEAAAD